MVLSDLRDSANLAERVVAPAGSSWLSVVMSPSANTPATARSPFEPPAPVTEPPSSPRFPEYSTEMAPMADGSKLEVVRQVIPDGRYRLSDVVSDLGATIGDWIDTFRSTVSAGL